MIKLNTSAGMHISAVCETAAKIAVWAARNPDDAAKAAGCWGAWAPVEDGSYILLLSWNPKDQDEVPEEAREHNDPGGWFVFQAVLETKVGHYYRRELVSAQVEGTDLRVQFEFNQTEVIQEETHPDHSIDVLSAALQAQWNEKQQAASKAYWTPERKAQRERDLVEAAKKTQTRREAVEAALVRFPFKPTDEAKYAASKAKNTDGYGSAVYVYAEAWAATMEARLADGATLLDAASEASHDADVEGMTGFMYGCAVSILSQFWVHGEDLRRWHNLKTQIGDEGEKANEAGGVLNPALMSIGTK